MSPLSYRSPDRYRQFDDVDGLPPAVPVRGIAHAPAQSTAVAPLVGVVVRASDREPKRARDWALFAMIVGYPVWRMLGFTLFIVPLLAVPMALELLRRRRVRYPAGFIFWVGLIVVGLVGVVMLNHTPPGAVPPTPGFGRYLAFAQRMTDYVAAGVILLYVGNLTERELPTRRVAKMLAALFVVVVFGGVLSLVVPKITITTPMAHLLPHSLAANPFVVHLVTVQFAQYQDVLSQLTGARPAFPFQYTNTWGEALVLLLPWFVIATLTGRRSVVHRVWALGVLVIALVPIVYSLNRGVWIALGLGVGYLVIRLAMHGRTMPAVVTLGVVGVIAAVLLLTPLNGVIAGRINTPHSNAGRTDINNAALVAARSSPIIGYGGQSGVIGSNKSIAIGRSAASNCKTCGNRDIGSDGQMWLLLITEGFVGLGLYVAFFLRFAWRYRRDLGWVGLTGSAIALLALWFMAVYTALELPLMIMMISLGLWWRHAVTAERRNQPLRAAVGTGLRA
jgi:hypothetical protein